MARASCAPRSGVLAVGPDTLAHMDRFWTKVRPTGFCWEWTAYIDPAGYGRFRLRTHSAYAHRVSYELLVGPIPDGLTLDHLCRNTRCVNPDHLEPVTQGENSRRARRFASRSAAPRTHCKRGHAFDLANTYHGPRGRNCRECNRLAVDRYRSRV